MFITIKVDKLLSIDFNNNEEVTELFASLKLKESQHQEAFNKLIHYAIRLDSKDYSNYKNSYVLFDISEGE